jgi:3-(3-hydroxy-phenyl)propionate hydroxylase
MADGVDMWTEAEPLLADWLQRNGVEAVIVRPDRYVFGGARSASELNALIALLARQLQGSQHSDFDPSP